MLIIAAFNHNKKSKNLINADVFASNADIIQKQDKVGANIWLKQTIHGENGINYRYVIETDCPSWDFQTRYMTKEPIAWIDETSAVEVIIYDTQVRYNGTVYANGQYYTIPLLGGISSETISIEEWQTNLIKQAYQSYVADMKGDHRVLDILIFLVIIMLIVHLIWLMNIKFQKQKKKSDTDNIRQDMCDTMEKVVKEWRTSEKWETYPAVNAVLCWLKEHKKTLSDNEIDNAVAMTMVYYFCDLESSTINKAVNKVMSEYEKSKGTV